MNLVFFGDSICFGQFVSPHKVWINQIAERLTEDYENIIISNPSISGNTTRMALTRMAYDVQSHGCDLIFIQFGINDCNFWETDYGSPRVSKRSFEANLHEIIERAKLGGAKRVLLNTNHPTNKIISVGGEKVPHQKFNEEYNVVVREVAHEHTDVILIDMENVFLDALKTDLKITDLLLSDGIHLSEHGHQFYFCEIYPFIKGALDSLHTGSKTRGFV